MSNPSATANTTGGGAGANLSRNFAVEEKNTIVFMVPDMPIMAATPDLVGIAEMSCYTLSDQCLN
jgi:hypothetical protein